MPVSRAFIEIIKPHIPCESSWRWDAVGPYGELGLLQINPESEKAAMEALGLDFYNEAHRFWYAEHVLYARRGLQPWQSTAGCIP